MTNTAIMIQNRIESLEQWGHDGELNGELFMFSLGEYGYLKELAEVEKEEHDMLDSVLSKMARESIGHVAQLSKALNIVNKLVSGIENMKYDCDGEVYETLVKLQDILTE